MFIWWLWKAQGLMNKVNQELCVIKVKCVFVSLKWMTNITWATHRCVLVKDSILWVIHFMIHTVLMPVGIRPHAAFIPKVCKNAHTHTHYHRKITKQRLFCSFSLDKKTMLCRSVLVKILYWCMSNFISW